ncbi:hypothetical protein GCM10009613_23280 [Pseudonocardia kongjuensis]|uniref:Uncharacterized protein n=1 Tax=Pseudonocardia kongjuensis TaxID=102227 RepID=A0ABP4ICM0_9PSEU
MPSTGPPRPLRAGERAVLERVLRDDPAERTTLLGQVRHAHVTGIWPDGSGSVDLDVPTTCPPADPAPAGIVPVDAVVHDDRGDPIGAVLIRVRDGRLSALEFAWHSGIPQPGLPGPDRLTIERPRTDRDRIAAAGPQSRWAGLVRMMTRRPHPPPSPLGERVDPYDLAGRTLLGVTADWFHPAPPDTDDVSRGTVWLDVEGIGHVMCHTRLALELYRREPHGPCDMGELGHVTVGPVDADFPLARFIGSRIDTVRIVQERLRRTAVWCDIGMSLYVGDDRVRVIDIIDDLVVTDGPLHPQHEWNLREV